MIQIEGTLIRDLILHRVGSEEENSIISDKAIDIEEEEEAVFKKALLKPFTSQAQTYEFRHEVGIGYNVLFNLSKGILEGENFVEVSKDILRHLVASSTHPNIKSGDLFIAKFDGIKVNNQELEGLGIYKYEDKESFIETTLSENGLKHAVRRGIGGKKPDKACLILFTEAPYTLLVIDNTSGETAYWQDDFIHHRLKNDHVNNTHHFMNMAKDFIVNQIPNEFEVSKADQIDLLNRSVDYFKKKEVFDKKEFETEVFSDPNVVDAFQLFDQGYRKENELEIHDKFEIAGQTVKKQSRIFKSVLKLDKNFHIYIHGDRNLIEQGHDEKGKKFYKLYYEEES
ncbi:nucleoid-associated protein [Ravibacter arvi]|uniref:Nucleoid-associated protein n=1 Tax=Ravibacter arvi TaxID=2051041 RepID=A0ABP8LUD5_9BACT